jgi:copper chaperone CopZ
MQTTRLKIEGMHCGACVQRVTKALGGVPGVVVNRVQVGDASISYDPEKVSPAAIAEAVNGIGFEVIDEAAV